MMTDEDKQTIHFERGRLAKKCPYCTTRLELEAQYCGICGRRLRTRLVRGDIVDDLYRVEEMIAFGGFATVYRAIYLPSGLVVALKVLHGDLSDDPRLAERFRREAKMLTRLRDKHTIATYDHGEAIDGTHYIAMELLRGESLHDRLARVGTLPWREALAIMRDVCSSLAEAHAHGIVHRDLKPANIHLGSPAGHAKNVVKLLDFGLAKMRGTDVDLTRAGQAVGTLPYMPPEQLLGHACDERTDLYALAIVAHEMLTGRRPFDEAPRTLPAEVEAMLKRCLACDPDDRFASAAELAREIERLLATPLRRTPEHTPVPERPKPVIALAWRVLGILGFTSGGVGLGTAVAQFV